MYILEIVEIVNILGIVFAGTHLTLLFSSSTVTFLNGMHRQSQFICLSLSLLWSVAGLMVLPF